MSTVSGDLASDGILSTKVLDEDIFVLSRTTGESARGARQVEFFASGTRWRTLHLEDVVRLPSGLIQSASLVGVVVSGADSDVAAIYQRVLQRDPLTPAELSRFRVTGHLGGDSRLANGSLICQCLGLSSERLLAAAARHGRRYEAVRKALGAGAVCGGCVSRVRDLLEARRVETPEAEHTPAPATRSSRLTVRAFEPRYDARPLAAIRGDHQLHLITLASLFAACGERFMIGAMLQAAPRLRDPELTFDLEAFLQQESNHVAAHEPLNRILAEEIYPDCPALQALRRLAFRRLEGASLELQLAVCAAFEFVADCIFSLHFEDVFRRSVAQHPDPEVEARLSASGVLGLFLWHGIEELGHRHVAFGVMKDHGVSYRTRVAGMLFTLWELSRAGTSALPELFWKTTKGGRRAYLVRALVRPALLRRLPRKLAPFFAPGFHPSRMRYPFLSNLESLFRQR